MTWANKFRWRQQAQQSLWLVPLAGALAGALAAFASMRLGAAIDLPANWIFAVSTSQAVLATIAGAMLSLIGFVLTVTVLVVQASTGTFSARILRFVYRDGMLKAALAFLVGTFAYAFVLLRHVDAPTIGFGVQFSGLLVMLGVVLFLIFISRLLQRLRPAVLASQIGRMGKQVFLANRPSAGIAGPALREPADGQKYTIASTRQGTLQALDVAGLVGWAERHACTLVFRHAVGDFICPQMPLFEVRGAAPAPADGGEIEGMVALGQERTIEQDPAFAIRIMVDIANRALSPAVNDPTSAVQVLDYLEDLLLLMGRSDLSAQGMYRDAGGTPRLIIPTTTWENFLALGVTEIRLFGGSSVQVVRRLRALLQRLHAGVRAECRPAVEAELARLEATARQFFGDSPDLDLAGAADIQGIGGPAPQNLAAARKEVITEVPR